MQEKNFDFDPDFSEYNPVLEELSNLKKRAKREDENFISSLIKKLITPVVILPME